MNFRTGHTSDIPQVRELAISSWSQFKSVLAADNWTKLYKILNNEETYLKLFEYADCILCEHTDKEIIGMAFLVPHGNPTDIYDKEWCHLRFVSVSPQYRGRGIGERLTRKCIELALANNEQTMALHTSEIMEHARYIYEKIGFTILKKIPPQLGVKYWLYTLDLNEIDGQNS